MVQRPLITIGITTYNRVNFLKKLVSFILENGIDSMEVLIGNDFQKRPLHHSDLMINDSRVKIFNHQKNLGEFQNLNFLFEKSTGLYFTWQFDDDFYDSRYFTLMASLIKKYDFPSAIFSNFDYVYGNNDIIGDNSKISNECIMSGAKFVDQIINRKIRTMGLTGLFKKDILSLLSGVPRVSDGKMALYSEYLLIFSMIQFDRVVYVKEKLLFNRIHSNSFSINSQDGNLFKEAGFVLLNKSLIMIKKYQNKIDTHKFINYLISANTKNYIAKSCFGFKDIRIVFIYVSDQIKAARMLFTEFKILNLILFNINIAFAVFIGIIRAKFYHGRYFLLLHKFKNRLPGTILTKSNF